jgi:UPF0755 protein
MIMNKGIRITLIAIAVIFAGLLIAATLYGRALSLKSAPGQARQITIESGESIDRIGGRLESAGLIRSAYLFKIYLYLSGQEKKIQAGEYLLPAGKDTKGIVALLLSGRASEQQLLIREGETAAEIGAGFEKLGLFTAADFEKVARTIAQQAKTGCGDNTAWCEFMAGAPDGIKPSLIEGSLFPDTYRFASQTTPVEAIEKLHDNFDRKLANDPVVKAKRSGESLYRVIIMASILEREVRTENDMKIAAGIFWRRLAEGQALQSDATLSYILDDEVSAHSKADLELDSPYNTYKYPGLPPGPIGNPGLIAIRAAIEPTATDYNYFLTAKDGKTIFSKTFEEHKRNKAKYLN